MSAKRSHLEGNGNGADGDGSRTISVHFGSRESPYLRVDPCFMDLDELDEEARLAFDALSAGIQRNLSKFVPMPGDRALIDNLKVVHGRKPFGPRYDGQGRWLKRINISRDLRKSCNDQNLPGSRRVA